MFFVPSPKDATPAKLPEDLTEARKKAHREETAAVLMGAASHGLRVQDYLHNYDVSAGEEAQDAILTDSLLRYANHRRFGRENPGIYGKPGSISREELERLTAEAGGMEAALRKLDPPFAQYARLEAALNQVAPDQRPLLEEAMEKWRWLPHELPRGAILVNIPEFRLQALDENYQLALDMRVVVGRITHQTPQFTGNLKYVVFGPFWNVPASILNNEIIPDIEKSRTYLSRNGYEVLDAKGKVVASDGEVTDEVLDGLKSGAMRVRQTPGAKNALGHVKFMFPNEENIYLHDTPSRSLFAREQRALSHGCVRVENPRGLAEWVLRDEPAWTKERIAEGLKKTKPEQANLTETIPVFMLYNTVTVGEDGQVQFLRDVYRKATSAAPAPRPRG